MLWIPALPASQSVRLRTECVAVQGQAVSGRVAGVARTRGYSLIDAVSGMQIDGGSFSLNSVPQPSPHKSNRNGSVTSGTTAGSGAGPAASDSTDTSPRQQTSMSDSHAVLHPTHVFGAQADYDPDTPQPYLAPRPEPLDRTVTPFAGGSSLRHRQLDGQRGTQPDNTRVFEPPASGTNGPQACMARLLAQPEHRDGLTLATCSAPTRAR